MSKNIVFLLGLSISFLTGCAHKIAFHEAEDASWKYPINDRVQDSGLVVVVDEETANAEYDFRSFMTGAANKWVVEYGKMLTQFADMELTQLVSEYERKMEYSESVSASKNLTLVLTIPEYVFKDFKAQMTLKADLYKEGKTLVFSREYQSKGNSELAKMYFTGAFGQKSSVRQSSLDTFKEIFEQLRSDLIQSYEQM